MFQIPGLDSRYWFWIPVLHFEGQKSGSGCSRFWGWIPDTGSGHFLRGKLKIVIILLG
jgi:hypothetical protein